MQGNDYHRNGMKRGHGRACLVWAILVGVFGMGVPAAAAEQHPAITYAVRPPGKVTGFAGDAQGNVYVVGVPNEMAIRTSPGVAYPDPPAGFHSYLMKLNPNGEVVYATYLPGFARALAVDPGGRVVISGLDLVNETLVLMVLDSAASVAEFQPLPLCPPVCGAPSFIRLDAAGNTYLAGESGPGLPVTPGAVQPAAKDLSDGFVIKVDTKTGKIIYATYIGGSDIEEVFGFAVDAEGNVYVGGTTESKDFPVTPGAYMTTPPQRLIYGFISKINPTGTALVYSTYSNPNHGVAIDASGAVYAGVGGVEKLSPDGKSLVFSSDPPASWAYTTAVDRSGNSFVGGITFASFSVSELFPQVNPLQAVGTSAVIKENCYIRTSWNPYYGYPCTDATLAKFDAQGRLLWSSALGGRGDDSTVRISVDAAGNLYAWVHGFIGFPLPGMRTGSDTIIKVEPAGPPPLLTPAGVVNSANYRTDVAFGGLVSLFGTNLTDAEGVLSASSFPLPMTLGGTEIFFGLMQAPILAVAKRNGVDQVNVQMPMARPEDSTWPGAVVVVKKGRLLGFGYFPGYKWAWASIFTDSSGRPLITHADFSPVSAEKPARAGETIVIFATGLGWVDPPVREGEAAPSPPARAIETPDVVIGGKSAHVEFSGLVPGFAGLYQVNVVVPEVTAGETALTIGSLKILQDRLVAFDTVRINVQ